MTHPQDHDQPSGTSGAPGTVPPDLEQVFGQSGLDLTAGPGIGGKLRAGYNLVIVALACIVMTAITLIMGAEVIFRYLLDSSLIWAEESCRYLLIWATFLFAGAAFQRGEMIAVEFFISRISRINRHAGLLISILGYVLVLVLLGYLVRYGYAYAAMNDIQMIPALDFIWSNMTGEPARISVFWVYISLPVGCTILAVHFLIAIVDKVARLFGAASPTGTERERFFHGDSNVGGA